MTPSSIPPIKTEKKEEGGEDSGGDVSNSGADVAELERNDLLLKYVGQIITSQDLLCLSAEERGEIKRLFNSEFYFLKMVKQVVS